MSREAAELTMLRNAADRVKRELAEVIAEHREPGEPAIVTTTRQRVAAALDAFDAVTRVCADAPGRLAPILDDPALSPIGRRDRANAERARIQADLAAELATMTAAVDDTLAAVARQLDVARPAGVDDTALAARKTDLMLVLDRLASPELVVDRLVRFAQTAADTGNALDSWLLLHTDWPALVLEARDGELLQPALDGQLAQVAERSAPAGGAEAAARAIRRAVQAPYGLRTLVALAQQWAHLALDNTLQAVA